MASALARNDSDAGSALVRSTGQLTSVLSGIAGHLNAD